MEEAISTSSIQFQGDHVLPRQCLQPLLGALTSHGASSAVPVSSQVAQTRRGEIPCCSGLEGSRGGIGVTLENKELWKQFHGIPNEMIVTKIGRRMFPLMQVSLSGLNPSLRYVILLEFQLTNNHRWRFLNGEWTASGSFNTTEPPQPSSVYVHTSSPLTGREWMKQKVVFSRVKLSNKEDGIGKVKLVSLYRYQPCIHIVQLDQPGILPQSPASSLHPLIVATHRFTETQFIAVTAYQNDKITQMKIKHNPFAKAFLGSQDTILPTSVPYPIHSTTYHLQFQTSDQTHPVVPSNPTSLKTAATYPSLATSAFPSLSIETPNSVLGPTHELNLPMAQPSFQTWSTTTTTDSSQLTHATSAYLVHPEYLANAGITNYCQPTTTYGVQCAPVTSRPSCFNHHQVMDYHHPSEKHAEENDMLPIVTTSSYGTNSTCPRPLRGNAPGICNMSYPEVMGFSEGNEAYMFQTTTLSNT